MKSKEHGNLKNRVGEKHITAEGYEVEIVEYLNTLNCRIKFIDGFEISNVVYNSIKKGNVKNPNHPSICGIGYIGQGSFKPTIKGKMTKHYNNWIGILERCYNEDYYIKKPTYIGCSVDERWHNFQNFAKWFYENYNPETMQGWHLDKDILVKGNKVYSPETCCFVPNEINGLFTKSNSTRGNYPIGVTKKTSEKFKAGLNRKNKSSYLGTFDTPKEAFEVYRFAKERYIKEVADTWKGKISDQVYQAMYQYQVEITD